MNDITRMLELAGLGHSPKQYEIAEQPSADHNVKVDTDFEQLVDYVRQLDRDGDIDISEPNAAQSIDALLAYEEPVGDQIPPTIDDIQAAINQVLHTSQVDVGTTVEIDQGPSRGQVGQVVEVSAGGGFVLVQTPQGQEYVPINEVSIKEDMLVPLEQNSMDESESMDEHYRRKLEAAEARVAELEKEKLRLEVRIADLQAQRDYWEEKCATREGWDNAFNTARDQAIAAGHDEFEFDGTTYPVTDMDPDDVERAKTRFDVTESIELSYDRYRRVHGKKPRLGSARGRYMFTTARKGDPESSEVFTFTGTGTDAGAAAKKWAKEQGKSVVYIMESEFDDMESEFDDDEQGFFVVLASEEEGVFIGMISQEDGRWRESVVSGTPPTNWGGAKYMSYLTAQDVMMWLEKDYGRHYEVLGPFSEDEAEEKAEMFESVPATISTAMKKVEAYSPGVYETLADKFGMVLEFSNTEDVLIPVQHEDRVLEFLLNQGYVEGHDFDLVDSLEEVDLQNGYRSQHNVDGNDYFPSAVTGPAAKRLGPGAEKHANNPLFTQRK